MRYQCLSWLIYRMMRARKFLWESPFERLCVHPASRELSFLERLGLLVDQHWTWRENQALARRLHAAKLTRPSAAKFDGDRKR
jgi:hypothetical protein